MKDSSVIIWYYKDYHTLKSFRIVEHNGQRYDKQTKMCYVDICFYLKHHGE